MDVGNLVVRLQGDVAPLRKNLAEMEQSLGEMEGLAKASSERFTGFFSDQFQQLVTEDMPGLRDGLQDVLGGIGQEMAQLFKQVLPAGSGGLPFLNRDSFLDRTLNRVLTTGAGMLGNALGGALAAGGMPAPVSSPGGGAMPVAGVARPMQLNMTVVTPDAASFKASQGQLLADSARAMQRAQRFV